MLLNTHGVFQQPSARDVYNILYVNCFKHKTVLGDLCQIKKLIFWSMHRTNCLQSQTIGSWGGGSTYSGADGKQGYLFLIA